MKYDNNPGNIRFNTLNRWQGLSGSRNGFCLFNSVEFGLRAFMILLRNYVKKYHLSDVDSIVQRYAPPTENNTSSYVRYCRAFLYQRGCSADNISVGTKSFYVLGEAMLRYESNFPCEYQRLENICRIFKIK